MSATGRGTVRNEADFYPTPLKAFHPLLPFLPKDLAIFEPACGDRRLINAMHSFGLVADGTDLKHGYDFLEQPPPVNFGCIVTNPPYSLAFEFVQHAVRHATEVFMLLRLNFLASKKRKEWFRANEPAAVFVLSERPSFAISVKCMEPQQSRINGKIVIVHGCGWRGLRATDDRPESCPKCGSKKLSASSSDSCDYGWMYWTRSLPRWRGIYHL